MNEADKVLFDYLRNRMKMTSLVLMIRFGTRVYQTFKFRKSRGKLSYSSQEELMCLVLKKAVWKNVTQIGRSLCAAI